MEPSNLQTIRLNEEEKSKLEEKRLLLQAILETILGSKNVYHQSPSNVRMSYPCIKYELDYMDTIYADNYPYLHTYRWLVTYITKQPDLEVATMFAKLPTCKFNRFYTSSELNHYVYRLYF